MAADDDFEAWLSGKPTPPPPRPTPPPPSSSYVPGTDDRYGRKALEDECWQLANTTEGSRNHQLNVAAFKLASLVEAGRLGREETIQHLRAAAAQCGLETGETEATIASAFRGSNAKVGARVVPELEEIPPAFTIDPNDLDEAQKKSPDDVKKTPPDSADGVGAEQSTAVDAENRDLYKLAVERRAYEMQVGEDARLLFTTRQAERLGQDAPKPIVLRDFLSTPDEDATYRITDLLPTGGRALLAAQQKAGKTSMIANLIRALADDGRFLDRFSVQQVNMITLIDNELDERMLRRWLRDQGIQNEDRVQVISLKGKIATFDIQNAPARSMWADELRGSDFIILDCLRPCLDVLGLSEDKDAGRFLVAWDALMTEVGGAESVVVHHMGHSQERSRGDSRLVDWPDVNWKIVKEAQSEDADQEGIDSDGGRRFFSAHGRDVKISESLLEWDPESRGLRLLEGGRRDAKARDAVQSVVDSLAEVGDGMTTNALTARLKEVQGLSFHTARKAIKLAIEQGQIYESGGARGSKILQINPSAVMSWGQP
jgi:hypothetical protein